ncbi:DUF2262 domain-containing protein [Clostridium tetani]|uniref:DUF2262 domain-containing protein n=1 Tax=Clostridium tetani TaxID=1513 RepID=UPI00100A2544|nr:DUF2262 domain-containing protein [Clostridium tetani]RXM71374.1 hypothetical protein DP143_11545 [Clostridium tetani]
MRSQENIIEGYNIEKLNIKVEDFEISNNIGSAECWTNAVIWGKDISISLDISLKDKDTFDNNKIENYIKEFKKHLTWIENNEKAICDALIESDMIGLAEEWVESSEETVINGEKVYVDGDNIFKLPISEEDFYKSLYFNSIVVRIDEDMEIMDSRIMIEAFIDTNPDYFAGHSMEVTITDNYKISVDGLAG